MDLAMPHVFWVLRTTCQDTASRRLKDPEISRIQDNAWGPKVHLRILYFISFYIIL